MDATAALASPGPAAICELRCGIIFTTLKCAQTPFFRIPTMAERATATRQSEQRSLGHLGPHFPSERGRRRRRRRTVPPPPSPSTAWLEPGGHDVPPSSG